MARLNLGDDSDGQWEIKFREDEEIEFFTELALHESERWITAVTKKSFLYPDDPRKSLENGILLCELLNCLKSGSVRRINRLPTPIAGLDNLNVFRRACRDHFGLNDTHLFDPSDLEDLSQRAIAESEHQLKEELDRRLRNVAITIYWLGRTVSQFYQGPKIDESAFSALVHHHHRTDSHLVEDRQLRRDLTCSWASNGGHSNVYGSHDHDSSRGSLRDTLDHSLSCGHVRDNSYDSFVSYGKTSEDSIEEHLFEVDEFGMPIQRYGSAMALNRDKDSSRGSAAEGSVYGSDRSSTFYRSSPDLSQGSFSKRRSSSTDSNDGSNRGSHSRQSSDSSEAYITRRYSTQFLNRKTSTSADPLQFVKSKGAVDLAVAAEYQMKLAAETKKLKSDNVGSKDDDTDWLSNLSSWKNRRKSHSEKSHALKEEQEQQEQPKNQEEAVTSTAAVKTFSQIKESNRQKSTGSGKHFYPIADEDAEGDDDLFTSSIAKTTDSSPSYRSGVRSQSRSSSTTKENTSHSLRKTKEEIAPWAQDSGNEEEEDNRKSSDSWNTSPNNRLSSNNNNDDFVEIRPRGSGIQRSVMNNDEVTTKENSKNSVSGLKSTNNKIGNILKNFENKDSESVKSKTEIKPDVDVSARKLSLENVDSYHSLRSNCEHDKPKSSRSISDHARSSFTKSEPNSSTVYTSSRQSGKDYVEKSIKISQKPNSEKGFGFTLSGGLDKRLPVTVGKVSLGSAADICELESKDEVISINNEDVSHLSSDELAQKVQDAVRVGQIELRIKRFLGSGDDFDNEFSSEDENHLQEGNAYKISSRAEHSFDSLDSRDDLQKVEIGGTSITSQLEKERKWLEQQIENSAPKEHTRRGEPASNSSDSGYNDSGATYLYRADNSSIASLEDELHPGSHQTEMDLPIHSADEHLYNHLEKPKQESFPLKEVEIEPRSFITVRHEIVDTMQNEKDLDEHRTGKTFQAHFEVLHPGNTGSQDSEGSGFQPPAGLRKWQRQRTRPEYTFESDEQPHFYTQMKISSIQSQSSKEPLNRGSDDNASEVSSSQRKNPPFSSRSFTSEERHRIQEWDRKQEEERKSGQDGPAEQSDHAVETPYSQDKQRYAVERQQIQHQYEEDLQKAALSEQLNEENERKMLEPEVEKLRILEERRAQRKARIQQYAQNIGVDSNYSSRRSATATESSSEYQLPEHSAQHTSILSVNIPNAVHTTSQSDVLVIDPRNRKDEEKMNSVYNAPVEASPGQPYHFQVKINQNEFSPAQNTQQQVVSSQTVLPSLLDQSAFLEAERERIRKEELQKLENELRMKEEEYQRIRTKEEQLRQQEELLKQEKEQLRLEQERFERERKQQQEEQQQQQSRHSSASETYMNSPQQFEVVTGKVRGGSSSYTSSVTPGPRRSEVSSKDSGSTYASRRSEYGLSSGSGAHSHISPHSQSSQSLRNGSHSYSVSQSQSSRNSTHSQSSSSQSGLPKWPPNSSNDQVKGSNTLPRDFNPKLYSREDMVAMNRKATPLQSKPPPSSLSTEQSKISVPIKREPPSKGQIHSLNSVPRAKFRDPNEWISTSKDDDSGTNTVRPHSSVAAPRHSGVHKHQFSDPEDHWMIQEAERRRSGISGPQFSGPIKPASDNFENKWREGSSSQEGRHSMPAQIRQTLLQRTAGARGSTGSNYSQELAPSASSVQQQISPNSLSQTLPSNFTFDGNYHSRNNPAPHSHHTPPLPDSKENGLSLSGKQKCSHCGQELGFGAAMVIESLGLCYHVQCFRCYVCRTPLGSGAEGTDVRVRVNKLHCPNCYSNDEGNVQNTVAWDTVQVFE